MDNAASKTKSNSSDFFAGLRTSYMATVLLPGSKREPILQKEIILRSPGSRSYRVGVNVGESSGIITAILIPPIAFIGTVAGAITAVDGVKYVMENLLRQ